VKSYLALKKAGVPAELHVYASGGHGFGLRANNPPPANDWTNRLEAWLRHREVIPVKAADGRIDNAKPQGAVTNSREQSE
jgi:hypothetical protein